MIKKYLEQDIDNPIYLFYGSSIKLDSIKPQQLNHYKENDVANPILLFPSFLKATPYAFKDTIKANSIGLDWKFEIINDNYLPLMTMHNVNISDDIIGYIYVFENGNNMIKNKHSHQYKCYDEITPIDIVKIYYKDFKKYYEVKN